jgi:hypothetical protein
LNKNYALTDDGKGGVLAHRADCPQARAAADNGEPVMTLYDCQGELPVNLTRHSCLESSGERPR